MGDRFLPIVAVFVTTILSWALLSYLIAGEINWMLAVIFSLSFSAVFGILWWRKMARESEKTVSD